MPELGTSGLMSGEGKRDDALRQHPRPSSTLPAAGLGNIIRAEGAILRPIIRARGDCVSFRQGCMKEG
jgi:hypothetical protein